MALRSPLKRELGLSGRLLVLTALFVTLAELLIYVPSLAMFRRSWLNDRVSAAHIAALFLCGFSPFGRNGDADSARGRG